MISYCYEAVTIYTSKHGAVWQSSFWIIHHRRLLKETQTNIGNPGRNLLSGKKEWNMVAFSFDIAYKNVSYQPTSWLNDSWALMSQSTPGYRRHCSGGLRIIFNLLCLFNVHLIKYTSVLVYSKLTISPQSKCSCRDWWSNLWPLAQQQNVIATALTRVETNRIHIILVAQHLTPAPMKSWTASSLTAFYKLSKQKLCTLVE